MLDLRRTTIALGLLLAAACDPVHDNAQAALGDEVPGIPTGPLHRAGQPCPRCHDGSLGSPQEFSVAGTIFQNERDRVAAVNATVTLTSEDGATYQARTNASGNFYIQPQQFAPRYPMKAEVTYGGVTVKMTSNIGRDGACAGCHVDPAGPTSPGHVFVPADGVAP